jgi:LacI family fructose operon transcriptional repressor
MTNSMNSYDIARMAKTTRSVVSLVINGKADQYRISRKTQDRVLAAVKQSGYVPNMSIHNLFMGQPELIGISRQTATLSSIVKPVMEAAGMELETVTLSDDPKTAAKQINDYINRDMAVLLLPPTRPQTKGDKKKDGKHHTHADAPDKPAPHPAKEKHGNKPGKPAKDKDKPARHKARHGSAS